MKITLKTMWFAPDGNRRRPGDHSVPDAWASRLPKTAVVLVPPKVAAPVAPAPAEDIEPVEHVEPVEQRKTLTVKK